MTLFGYDYRALLEALEIIPVFDNTSLVLSRSQVLLIHTPSKWSSMSDLDSNRLLVFVSASARVYAREKERSHKLFIKNNCDSRICLSKHVVNYEGLYYGNATKEQYICVSSPPDVLIGGIEQSAVITYSLNLLRTN